jgi:hypothetical protein
VNRERIHHELWREAQTVRLSAEAVNRCRRDPSLTEENCLDKLNSHLDAILAENHYAKRESGILRRRILAYISEMPTECPELVEAAS